MGCLYKDKSINHCHAEQNNAHTNLLLLYSPQTQLNSISGCNLCKLYLSILFLKSLEIPQYENALYQVPNILVELQNRKKGLLAALHYNIHI